MFPLVSVILFGGGGGREVGYILSRSCLASCLGGGGLGRVHPVWRRGNTSCLGSGGRGVGYPNQGTLIPLARSCLARYERGAVVGIISES